MTRLVVMRLLVEHGPEKNQEMLEEASLRAAEQATKALQQLNYKVLCHETGNRYTTKEESMMLVPKKTHYGFHNVPACSEKRHVPNSRLTEDWKKVTCRHCMKHRPRTMQTELFS